MAETTAARTCTCCGARLSRYNTGARCASCEQTSTRPAAPGVDDWIRPTVAELSSDEAGAVLREWRRANGISQSDLAVRLGWTQQHLSQIENGKTFTIDHRRHVTRVLDLAPEDLGLSSRQSRGISSGHDVSPEIAASRHKWRLERSYLNHHRSQLAKLAVDLYPAEHRLAETTLIAHRDWLPAAPADLRSIALDLDDERRPVELDGSEPATAAVRPLRSPGVRFEQYTDAVKHIDPPELFENRPSYRLLDVALPDLLRFGLAVYFEKLNVSEGLGHELAAAAMHAGDAPPASVNELRGRLPFREAIGDPFDLTRRANVPAITTLTIRLRPFPHEPSFLLHWRDPAKVATAGGTYDVIPAGEFQPSSVFPADLRNDFDLWRNMVREYSEELLGAPEHEGTRAADIDYANWPLFTRLEQAQREGTVCAYLLGIGLDALTLATTIMTVVVIEDPVFNELFGATVRYNAEGEIVAAGRKAAEGIPFSASSVDRLLTREPMASPGAGCLALAWEHRGRLLP